MFSENKMKNKRIIAIFYLVVSFGFYLTVNAQQNQQLSINSNPIQGYFKVLATVNPGEAKIISQNENKLKISFVLTNRERIQPGIKYAVELYKIDAQGMKTLITSEVYPESLTLAENSTFSKEIEYDAPQFLNGIYQVQLTFKNEKGLRFGFSNAGDATFSGTGKSVEIEPASCGLKIEPSSDAKIYSPMQGVDISKDEKLIATCTLKNNSASSFSATPQVTIYARDIFGKQLSQTKVEKLDFSNSQEQNVSWEIPIVSKPQAYDAEYVLLDAGGKEISNEMIFHFVLQGLSATVQNVRFDKESYLKGETANIIVNWNASADFFRGARGAGSSAPEELFQISIANEKGKVCADPIKFSIDPKKESSKDLSVAIEDDCVGPQGAVVVANSNGNELDRLDYKIQMESQVGNEEQSSVFKNRLIAFIIVCLSAVVLLFLTYAILKRKKNISIFLFLIASGTLVFFAAPEAVSADTVALCATSPWFSTACDFGNATFGFEGGRTSYSSGDPVVAKGELYYGGCDNSGIYGSFYASTDGVTKTIFSADLIPGYSTRSGSARFSAGTPGTHTMNFNVDFHEILFDIRYDDWPVYASGAMNYFVVCKDTSWSEWSPPKTDYFSCEKFTQHRTSNCGTPDQRDNVEGTKLQDWTAWSPLRRTICPGVEFRQKRYSNSCGVWEEGPIRIDGLKNCNNEPTATIESPGTDDTEFVKGNVYLKGVGTDPDGSIIRHVWFLAGQCDIDPVTGDANSCSGTPKYSKDTNEAGSSIHEISDNILVARAEPYVFYYRVKDNDNKWSAYFRRSIKVKNPVHTLNVSINDSDIGKVTGGAGDIRCGKGTVNDCSESYSSSPNITLTAVSSAGASFSSWNGCDSNPRLDQCRVRMDADKNIVATFTNITTCTPACGGSAKAQNYCKGTLYDSGCGYTCQGEKDCTGWIEVDN